MRLSRLRLDSFRNYASLDWCAGSGMHILSGENAQGKTNLLEAVYFAAVGRSPRAAQEGELISWGSETAHVAAEFLSDERGPFLIEVGLQRVSAPDGEHPRGRARKTLTVNGVARTPASLAGLVPLVLFLVGDLDTVRGAPAARRDYLDAELCAMSRTYGSAQRHCARALEQRNSLLRDVRAGLAPAEDVAPWTAQFVEWGSRVLEMRLCFVRDLAREAGPVHARLARPSVPLDLSYVASWTPASPLPTERSAIAAALSNALAATQESDVARGGTGVGPHRDDLRLEVGGRDLRHYGSQGEQRTAALSLRVAQFLLMRTLVGEAPVLLLDDVFSELDRGRRAALLAHLGPVAQVILTTTDGDALGLEAAPDVLIHRIAAGTLVAAMSGSSASASGHECE